MAASAGPSYLTRQEISCLIGQVPNHLFHPSGQSPSKAPESWDTGQLGWVPYHEGLQRHFGGLSLFSSGEPPHEPGGGPLLIQAEVSQFHLDFLVQVLHITLVSQEEVSLVCLDHLVEEPLVC